MSHKIIHTFNFTSTPSITIVRVEEFHGNRFSLLLRGTFGGATISVKGGSLLRGLQPVRVTDPSGGGAHNLLNFAFVGMFNFNACCTHLQFDLGGGAAPDVNLDLFTVPRPVK